jgi:hypothetical protein
MRFYRENVSKLAMGLIEMYSIPGAFSRTWKAAEKFADSAPMRST